MTTEPASIGRYRVLGELGQGAMGVVYLAEDPLLKRSVALKVVHGGAKAQSEALERFRREAEISAQLNHPNVITIFDVGEAPGLGPFLAMEYIDGRSLRDLLEEGPLEHGRAMLLLLQAHQALEAAHRAGIVHRDIKPANLLIDRAGRLKLVDFGIARRQAMVQTVSGVVCTPCFVAPELLEGEPPSATTDRWALSVVAFQCLAGRLPFEGETLSAVLFAVAHKEPDLPAPWPEELCDVFRRAFAREPAQRQPDSRSFMEELLAAVTLPDEVRQRCLMLLEAGLAPPAGAAPSNGASRRSLSWKQGALGSAALVLVLVLGTWLARSFHTRRLSVVSHPEGARVLLDGEALGTTPLRELRIPTKKRSLRLEKEGFQPSELRLADGDQSLTVTLEALPILLDLDSEPRGAEVYLNGILRGVTPLKELSIPGEGSHKLLVQKAGWENWTMTVDARQKPPALIQLRRERPKAKEAPGFWKRFFGKN